MGYTYSTFYDEPYTYDGGLHQFDPTTNVPVPADHKDYGRTLKDVVGMSDAEAETIVTSQKWKQIRAYRDTLLAETDWWGNSDVTMSDLQVSYRQALRDITNVAHPDDVVWPTKPE